MTTRPTVSPAPQDTNRIPQRRPLCALLLLATLALPGAGWTSPVVIPSSLQAGYKVTTEPSATRLELRLRNASTGFLQFTGAGIAITGPDAADFQFIDPPSTAPMSNSEFRDMPLNFKPQTVGSKSASIVITTDDPTVPQLTVPLTGTAVADRATTVSGPYDGYGPGISTIGPGGDYSSLFAATSAISTHPLTGGDWTFLVTGNLTEPNNSIFGQPNTNGHSITFRPAPGTSPVVTFTTTTANPPNSIHGHIVIGARVINMGLPAIAPYPTSRIIIDGSDIPGETRQSLTFTNQSTNPISPLLHIYGDSDHIQVKNTRFRYAVPNDSIDRFRAVIDIAAIEKTTIRPDSPPDAVPDYGIINNCDISTSGTNAVVRFGIAINDRRGDTPAGYNIDPGSVGIQITSNTITNLPFGISAVHCKDALIAHNDISLPAGPEPYVSSAGGIWCSIKQTRDGATTTTINANTIKFISDGSSRKPLAGILISSEETTNSINVTNNMISGLTAPPKTNPIYILSSGIRNSSDNLCTVTIAHNSIAFVQSADAQATAPRCAAISNSTINQYFAGTSIIRNNIIRLGTPGSCAILRLPPLKNAPPATLISDNNIIHAAPGTYVAYTTENGGTIYETLQEWQTATGQDLNSVDLDPHVPLAPGLGTWHGTPTDINPDLHFTAYPGDPYRVPRLAYVPADIDNQPRSPQTTAGADDQPNPGSSVKDWSIY